MAKTKTKKKKETKQPIIERTAEEEAVLARYRDKAPFHEGEQPSLLSLPRAKNPAGGGIAWTLPNGEVTTELTGVIAAYTVSRTLWGGSYEDSDGSPPACSSIGGVHGRGDPGGLCAHCPENQWIDGRKACRESAWLIMVIEGTPCLVTVPPTSLRAWLNYRVALATGGDDGACAVEIVETTITASLVKDGANEYAVFEFSATPLVGGGLLEADKNAQRYEALATATKTQPALGYNEERANDEADDYGDYPH